MNSPRISLIAILSENRVIADGHKIPWHIREDLQRFKQLTLHHPVIMGRKTYEAMGKLLPERTNIIITHQPEYQVNGAVIVHSPDEALDYARKVEEDEIFVIGGGEVFKEVMPQADRLYLTLVCGNYAGNIYFPDFSEFTKVMSEENLETEGYHLTFLTLERT